MNSSHTPHKNIKPTPSSLSPLKILIVIVSFLVSMYITSALLNKWDPLKNNDKWARLEKALKKGEVDIEMKINQEGSTFFLEAAAEGNVKAMKMLIAQGANTQARANTGMTALHFAAGAPDGRPMLFLLKEADLDLNIESRTDEGMTPFSTAAIFGNVEAMQILAQEGADVHTTNKYGSTALHQAVILPSSQGRSILWLLKEAHLDIESQMNGGVTPFLSAVFVGNIEAMQILKENGADLQARDMNGKQAPDYAEKIKDPNQREKVYAWLRDNGFNLS